MHSRSELFTRGVVIGAVFLLSAVAAPVAAQGAADMIKAGCNVQPTYTDHLFDLQNNSLPFLCGVQLVPQPGTGCPINAGSAPAGWTVTVNPDGSAHYMSDQPGNCVQQGSTLSGFSFTVDGPGTCCYYVYFLNGEGSVVAQTTRCCNCSPVSIEATSWGGVKALYN